MVLLAPGDVPYAKILADVTGDLLKRAGFNVDYQSMDWGTLVQRRAKQEPLDKGGWSLFPSGNPAAEYVDPLLPSGVRGNGAKAWFGWPTDERLEALREQWLDETDPAKQKALCALIQARCLEVVTSIPLGQYLPPAAWSKKISTPLKGMMPVFWGVEKA